MVFPLIVFFPGEHICQLVTDNVQDREHLGILHSGGPDDPHEALVAAADPVGGGDHGAVGH